MDAETHPARLPGGAGSADEALETLKRLLRRLRVEQGLSMGGLALRAGLGRTTTSQALNGATVPSESTLVSLARALRTPADPLLDLRTLACPGGGAPAATDSEGMTGPREQDTGRTPTGLADRETRFTYEYLARRPTSLLRVLHGKLRDAPLVGLRIRMVDVYRSARFNAPDLPARMVQYADECLAFGEQIRSRRDGVEALFLLTYLTVVSEVRSASDAAYASVYHEILGSAMVFLDHGDLDSLVFLEMQGLVERWTRDGGPPWPHYPAFDGELGPEPFPPYE
ncbi:helix-turn-helix domain-containing protein [Streptomyces sp. NPDC002073]|uniref:helix-turn-helix domain-containing protein n=1 Tax=Streptomyces sp. NBC_00239 TaxID=2903640 RepID=UPI002E29D736|nr:helix-turn-helix domain-containing protein [Streptomyces sp. NBC_00239]